MTDNEHLYCIVDHTARSVSDGEQLYNSAAWSHDRTDPQQTSQK